MHTAWSRKRMPYFIISNHKYARENYQAGEHVIFAVHMFWLLQCKIGLQSLCKQNVRKNCRGLTTPVKKMCVVFLQHQKKLKPAVTTKKGKTLLLVLISDYYQQFKRVELHSEHWSSNFNIFLCNWLKVVWGKWSQDFWSIYCTCFRPWHSMY